MTALSSAMRRVSYKGIWLVALGLAVLAAPGSVGRVAAASDQVTPRITSHSQAYCDHLSARMDALILVAHVPPSSEMISLAEEGRRMCDLGQMRGGILRLRRALLLLQEATELR